MKLSNLYKLFLLLPAAVVGLAAVQFSGGAPPGRTGAPNEATCVMCHNGVINSGGGSATISIEGNPTTYKPGQTYNITVSTAQENIRRFGFQITALDKDNKFAGVLTPSGNDLQIAEANQRVYLTHTRGGGDGGEVKAWKFTWKAPATNVGKVTMYVAWMASNSDGNNTGDNVYTTTASLDPDLTSISSKELPANWSLAPNPTEGNFRLRFDMTQPQEVELNLVNTSGQVVFIKNWTSTDRTFDESVSLNHLAKGVYMAQVKIGEKGYVERIVIR